MDPTLIVTAIVALVLGVFLGYLARILFSLWRKRTLELEIKQTILSAKEEARNITEKANKKAEEKEKEVKEEEKKRKEELQKAEDRLIKKEELLDKRQADIDAESDNLKEKNEEAERLNEKLSELEKEKEEELQKIASLSKEEAVNEIYKKLEKEYEEDILIRMQKLDTVYEEKLKRKAKDILANTVQRLSSSTASETMTTSVNIQSEDIKGKIIGKEGRNIRAFERTVGVELIVDDTPGVIVISSFDPIRRQIGKLALENLMLDGRIQPAKIEETVEKAQEEINKIIKEKGEQAVYECGAFNLDPRLVSILGRLYFRTSYGQNVLQHSIETAHLSGMLAEELNADVNIAKTAGLLHDIGKALDHEVSGTHVQIGIRVLQKFEVDEKIITAMKSHHDDFPHESLEAVIVQTADSISGGRPGARRDTMENYLKRLDDLEAIANTFKGIDKAYALQAGREIRVFVSPEEVSDLEAKQMAREMAIKVEGELKYPGEIKVTMIRESRVIEHAR